MYGLFPMSEKINRQSKRLVKIKTEKFRATEGKEERSRKWGIKTKRKISIPYTSAVYFNTNQTIIQLKPITAPNAPNTYTINSVVEADCCASLCPLPLAIPFLILAFSCLSRDCSCRMMLVRGSAGSKD